MIEGILLDLGGVLYVGEAPLPGARDAVARLHDAGLPLRYITNTTRQSRRALLAKLHHMRLEVEREELFMPAIAARRVIEQEGLSPTLLVHPALEEDFAGLPQDGEPAVVVGDAAEGFTYARLNQAFRLLKGGARFLALARNRSFRDADGELSLDAGPFVAALEYACEREAMLLGKPSPDFFAAALDSLGCTAEQAVMVGDDAQSDVEGAMAAGLKGVLVRTGKYEAGAETRISPQPSYLAADLAEAADWILGQSDRAV